VVYGARARNDQLWRSGSQRSRSHVHTRLKIYSEAWLRHHSRPLGSSGFSSLNCYDWGLLISDGVGTNHQVSNLRTSHLVSGVRLRLRQWFCDWWQGFLCCPTPCMESLLTPRHCRCRRLVAVVGLPLATAPFRWLQRGMEQSATRDSGLLLNFDIPKGDQVSPSSSVIRLTWRCKFRPSADVCVELCSSFRYRFCKVPPQLCDGSIIIHLTHHSPDILVVVVVVVAAD